MGVGLGFEGRAVGERVRRLAVPFDSRTMRLTGRCTGTFDSRTTRLTGRCTGTCMDVSKGERVHYSLCS